MTLPSSLPLPSTTVIYMVPTTLMKRKGEFSGNTQRQSRGDEPAKMAFPGEAKASG